MIHLHRPPVSTCACWVYPFNSTVTCNATPKSPPPLPSLRHLPSLVISLHSCLPWLAAAWFRWGVFLAWSRVPASPLFGSPPSSVLYSTWPLEPPLEDLIKLVAPLYCILNLDALLFEGFFPLRRSVFPSLYLVFCVSNCLGLEFSASDRCFGGGNPC